MLPGVRDWRKVDEVLLQRACRREVDVLIKGRQKRILMVMNCSVSWLWWWIHEPAPVIMLYTHTHTQRSTNKAGEKTPGSSLEPLSWLWHWTVLQDIIRYLTVLQDITVARYYKISYSFARYYRRKILQDILQFCKILLLEENGWKIHSIVYKYM